MTKDEAILKIRKFVALAKGTSNPNEKQVALDQAKKLMAEHHLTAEEIDNQAYLIAFEEISKEVVEFTDKNPVVDMGFFGGFNLIGELIRKSKDVSPTHKVSLIKKIKSSRTMILFLLGTKYEPLLDRIDTIIANHNL